MSRGLLAAITTMVASMVLVHGAAAWTPPPHLDANSAPVIYVEPVTNDAWRPIAPEQKRIDNYNDIQDRVGALDPTLSINMVVGDSRGAMGGQFTGAWLDNDPTHTINIAQSGTTLLEMRWFMERTGLDLSAVQYVILNGPGLNTMNHADDTPYEIQQNIRLLIRDITLKVGHPVKVYFMGIMGEGIVGNNWYFTPTALAQTNTLVEQYCDDNPHKCTYIANPDVGDLTEPNNPLVTDDERHYTPLAYSTLVIPAFHQAITGAAAAN